MPRLWPSALVTSDGERFVLIGRHVVRRLERFLAQDKGTSEAGGVLLGFRRGAHLEVLSATLPSSQDGRTRFSFVRRGESHQRVTTRTWKRSGCLVDYLGEWHSHPQEFPTPSGIDRREMIRRSCAHREEMLLELIVGECGVYAAVVDQGRYAALKVVSVTDRGC